MASVTDTSAFGATLGHRIKGLRASLADHLAKRGMYRATMNELSALDDRDLNDLGINRSMIKSIATEAAYGK